MLRIIALLLCPLPCWLGLAQELAGHGVPVRAARGAAGDSLASAGFDRAVILWDAGRARRGG